MENQNSSRPDIATPDIATEACAWIAQLESGDLSREDIAAFREWFSRSPRHREEIRRHMSLWESLDSLSMMRDSLDDILAERAAARRPIMRLVTASPGLRVVCGTLLLLIAASFYLAGMVTWGGNDSVFVETAVGETYSLALSDGSTVNVNTNSQLEVTYSRHERKIRMLKGEAMFDVAHDADRPFTVYAGGQSVTAIGTAFAVRMASEGVKVAVVEGRVEVAAVQTPEKTALPGDDTSLVLPSPLAVLIEGQTAQIQNNTIAPIETLGTQEISRQHSWQRGVLEFSGESLADVVAEIIRYTDVHIEIADADLGAVQVGGVFRVGDTEALYFVLEESFGVVITRVSEDHVILSKNLL